MCARVLVVSGGRVGGAEALVYVCTGEWNGGWVGGGHRGVRVGHQTTTIKLQPIMVKPTWHRLWTRAPTHPPTHHCPRCKRRGVASTHATATAAAAAPQPNVWQALPASWAGPTGPHRTMVHSS